MLEVRAVRLAAAAGGAMAFAIASYWSVRLALADHLFHQRTRDAVEHAVRLAPGNTEYLALRALQVEYDGGDSTPLLERAAALNPQDASLWIRLGLGVEVHGDMRTAEKLLLHAADINRQYEPRWTMANFYFRRGNSERFWHWARKALEVSYDGSRRPVFDLCAGMNASTNDVLARAMPPREPVVRDYLAYIMDTRPPAEAIPVARKLAALRNPADRPLLLLCVRHLIDARETAAAFSLWQSETGASTTNSNGELLTNAHFATYPPAGGFDWRVAAVDGVSVYRDVEQLKLVLNGNQPETVELLSQMVRVAPVRHCRLSFESALTGTNSESGLTWTVTDANGAALGGVAISAGEEWHVQQMQFDVPDGTEFVRLTLGYRRPPGSARLEGTLQIRKLSLRGSP